MPIAPHDVRVHRGITSSSCEKLRVLTVFSILFCFTEECGNATVKRVLETAVMVDRFSAIV